MFHFSLIVLLLLLGAFGRCLPLLYVSSRHPRANPPECGIGHFRDARPQEGHVGRREPGHDHEVSVRHQRVQQRQRGPALADGEEAGSETAAFAFVAASFAIALVAFPSAPAAAAGGGIAFMMTSDPTGAPHSSGSGRTAL